MLVVRKNVGRGAVKYGVKQSGGVGSNVGSVVGDGDIKETAAATGVVVGVVGDAAESEMRVVRKK